MEEEPVSALRRRSKTLAAFAAVALAALAWVGKRVWAGTSAMVVYPSANSAPSTRSINYSTYVWSSSSPASDVGSLTGSPASPGEVLWTRSAVQSTSTNRTGEMVLVTLDSYGQLVGQYHAGSGGGWSTPQVLATNMPVATLHERAFDVAYSSDTAIVVAANGSNNTTGNQLQYWTLSCSGVGCNPAWSAGTVAGYTQAGANPGNVRWVRLAARPSQAREVGIAIVDSNGTGNNVAYGRITNETTFNWNNTVTGAGMADIMRSDPIDLAWEQLQQHLIVVFGTTTANTFAMNCWNGSIWVSVSTPAFASQTLSGSGSASFASVRLAPQPGTNVIALAAANVPSAAANSNSLRGMYWEGPAACPNTLAAQQAAWTNYSQSELTNTYFNGSNVNYDGLPQTESPYDLAWQSDGDYLIYAYSDGSNYVRFKTLSCSGGCGTSLTALGGNSAPYQTGGGSQRMIRAFGTPGLNVVSVVAVTTEAAATNGEGGQMYGIEVVDGAVPGASPQLISSYVPEWTMQGVTIASDTMVYSEMRGDMTTRTNSVPANWTWSGTPVTTPQVAPTGSPNSAPHINGARFAILRAGTTRDEKVLVTQDNEGNLKGLVWTAASGWNTPNGAVLFQAGIDANAAARMFDVAYERKTGRAIVFWSVPGGNTPKFDIWNGTNWVNGSSEGGSGNNFPWALTATPWWMRAEPSPDPANDYIIILGLDNSNSPKLSSWFWKGNGGTTNAQFVSSMTLENVAEAPSSANPQYEAFDVAWEQKTSTSAPSTGPRAMVAWGSNASASYPAAGSNILRYNVFYPTGSWSCATNVASPTPGGCAGPAQAGTAQDIMGMRLAGNPGNSEIVGAASLGNWTLSLDHWNGNYTWDSTGNGFRQGWATALNRVDYNSFDLGCVPDGSGCLAVVANSTTTVTGKLSLGRFTAGSNNNGTWTDAAAVVDAGANVLGPSPNGGNPQIVQVAPDSIDNKMYVVVSQAEGGVYGLLWDSGTAAANSNTFSAIQAPTLLGSVALNESYSRDGGPIGVPGVNKRPFAAAWSRDVLAPTASIDSFVNGTSANGASAQGGTPAPDVWFRSITALAGTASDPAASAGYYSGVSKALLKVSGGGSCFTGLDTASAGNMSAAACTAGSPAGYFGVSGGNVAPWTQTTNNWASYLTEGVPYTASVLAVDKSSNTQASPASISFILDKTAPTGGILTPSTATAYQRQNVTFTGVVIDSAGANQGSLWTALPQASLAAIQFKLRYVDKNTGVNFLQDNMSWASGSDVAISTNSGTGGYGVGAVGSAACTANGSIPGNVYSCSWAMSFPKSIWTDQTTYYLTLQAMDRAGSAIPNASVSTVTFVIDETTPTVATTQPFSNLANYAGGAPAGWTGNAVLDTADSEPLVLRPFAAFSGQAVDAFNIGTNVTQIQLQGGSGCWDGLTNTFTASCGSSGSGGTWVTVGGAGQGTPTFSWTYAVPAAATNVMVNGAKWTLYAKTSDMANNPNDYASTTTMVNRSDGKTGVPFVVMTASPAVSMTGAGLPANGLSYNSSSTWRSQLAGIQGTANAGHVNDVVYGVHVRAQRNRDGSWLDVNGNWQPAASGGWTNYLLAYDNRNLGTGSCNAVTQNTSFFKCGPANSVGWTYDGTAFADPSGPPYAGQGNWVTNKLQSGQAFDPRDISGSSFTLFVTAFDNARTSTGTSLPLENFWTLSTSQTTFYYDILPPTATISIPVNGVASVPIGQLQFTGAVADACGQYTSCAGFYASTAPQAGVNRVEYLLTRSDGQYWTGSQWTTLPGGGAAGNWVQASYAGASPGLTTGATYWYFASPTFTTTDITNGYAYNLLVRGCDNTGLTDPTAACDSAGRGSNYPTSTLNGVASSTFSIGSSAPTIASTQPYSNLTGYSGSAPTGWTGNAALDTTDGEPLVLRPFAAFSGQALDAFNIGTNVTQIQVQGSGGCWDGGINMGASCGSSSSGGTWLTVGGSGQGTPTFSWSYPANATAMANGAYTLFAKTKDIAGNPSNYGTLTTMMNRSDGQTGVPFVISNTSPTVTMTGTVPPSAGLPYNSSSTWRSQLASIQGTAAESNLADVIYGVHVRVQRSRDGSWLDVNGSWQSAASGGWTNYLLAYDNRNLGTGSCNALSQNTSFFKCGPANAVGWMYNGAAFADPSGPP
ncbi:MAG: hypothetical protein NTX64_16700, partial [Elusimicrobia bacterium]|nr:hypothetical protein [Elusimicrobiota bacterium]